MDEDERSAKDRLIEYGRRLKDAGFTVWFTPSGRESGWLTYEKDGLFGTLQRSDYEGWQHLMPLVPSREFGSSMHLEHPLNPWSVEAAQQCARPTNYNKVIGTHENARSAWISGQAVLL